MKFLKQMIKDHGPTRVNRLIKREGKIDWPESWTEWRNISDLSDEELKEINLRELFRDEVLLDCEEKEQGKNVIQQLIEEGYSFTAWDTGSRGIHISLFFPELWGDKFDNTYTLARVWFIKLYGTDPSKRAGILALENCPHFKTGKPKTLIRKHDNGLNLLPEECLEFIRQETEREQQQHNPIVPEELASDVLEILRQDELGYKLWKGDLCHYKTGSEARMALICILVALGLDDNGIIMVMDHSSGLNWQEKPHLHNTEISKARGYVTQRR